MRSARQNKYIASARQQNQQIAIATTYKSISIYQPMSAKKWWNVRGSERHAHTPARHSTRRALKRHVYAAVRIARVRAPRARSLRGDALVTRSRGAA